MIDKQKDKTSTLSDVSNGSNLLDEGDFISNGHPEKIQKT